MSVEVLFPLSYLVFFFHPSSSLSQVLVYLWQRSSVNAVIDNQQSPSGRTSKDRAGDDRRDWTPNALNFVSLTSLFCLSLYILPLCPASLSGRSLLPLSLSPAAPSLSAASRADSLSDTFRDNCFLTQHFFR